MLILLLLVQLVRLLYTILSPVTPYGDWRPSMVAVLSPNDRIAIFSSFDPFNRGGEQSADGPAVTSLDIVLFGITVNAATGGGSAIIAGPDGIQNSFAVGMEIAPGATLAAVAQDHVVIERGGVRELLYIDQSIPAETVGASGNASGASASLTSEGIRQGVGFSPREEEGRITGISVTPEGDGAIFEKAGFRNGDIIVAIAGRPVTSRADIATLSSELRPGARLMLTIERGANTLPIAVNLE